MKYKISSEGRVAVGERHVVLDEETGNGVWVQPGAVTAAHRLQGQWKRLFDEALLKYAESEGKSADEVTEAERANIEPTVTEDFTSALSAALETCLVRWDEGLVELDDGTPVGPNEEVCPGTTARDAWVEHMAEHDVRTAVRLLAAASGIQADLSGNSSGPSGGIGATEEAPAPAEARESTVTDDQRAAPQAPAERAAGTSEVPVSPV